MPTRRSWWLLVLFSCVRAPPTPVPSSAPPPPPVVIPRECADLQGGTWRHASDSRFRYEASDDGGSLALSVFFKPAVDGGRPARRFSRDGGLAWLVPAIDAGVGGGEEPIDGEPPPIAQLVLRRTPMGFVGVVSADDAGACAFPARIMTCEPGALVLETIARQPRDCSLARDAGWTSHRLLKAGFDAGEPSDTMRHDLPDDGGRPASSDGQAPATPPPAH